MKEKIIEALKEIEVEYDITILFACETGSRAWATRPGAFHPQTATTMCALSIGISRTGMYP